MLKSNRIQLLALMVACSYIATPTDIRAMDDAYICGMRAESVHVGIGAALVGMVLSYVIHNNNYYGRERNKWVQEHSEVWKLKQAVSKRDATIATLTAEKEELAKRTSALQKELDTIKSTGNALVE